MNAQLLIGATKGQLLIGATKVQLLLGAVKHKAPHKPAPTTGSSFTAILDNIVKTVQSWGDKVILFVGVVLIIYGAFALFKAIKSLGGQQGPGGGGGMEWVKAVLAIIIGILLTATKVADLKDGTSINGSTLKQALNGEG